MVFSSIMFLYCFLPITLILYFCMPKVRNLVLLVCSLFFYFWGSPEHIWIIILSIIINYFFGLFIYNTTNKNIINKILLIICIILNVGMLFYYKYLDYFIEIANNIFKTDYKKLGIVLPIGISFFTFQGLSYVIDLYRGNIKVQRNPLKIALYIALFPQLIAGPIVRYIDIENQIDKRKVSLDEISYGIRRFIFGLSKKVLIANTLAKVADEVFDYVSYANMSTGTAWLGIIAYSLQIYFDFSGYSDMAIGLGRIFGFSFNENFNLPYISKSVTEFWRRWHISLSSFFRDYLYIPLGGGRSGNVYINLFIVFLATGIWHGASATFWIWGVYHGIFVIIERMLKNKEIEVKAPVIFKHFCTIFIVILGWVFFRADTLERALEYISCMFSPNRNWIAYSPLFYLNRFNLFILILAILLSIGVGDYLKDMLIKILSMRIYNIMKIVGFVVLCTIVTVRVLVSTYDPFIYFRF